MNTKNLYKALCLLSVFVVHQANSALLLNPVGPDYTVADFCSGCSGITDISVDITANNTIVLNFDSVYALLEDISIDLNNSTGAGWSNLTIEYRNLLDPNDDAFLGLSVLFTGNSVPTVDAILYNPVTSAASGLALSFVPDELAFVTIVGTADRTSMFDPYQEYSITISTSAVPVPAAAWLFGSGLIGLVGAARRKKA